MPRGIIGLVWVSSKVMQIRVDNALKNLLQPWEKYLQRAWVWVALGLGFSCGLAFLWNLGNIGLIDETEPLFAEAARQMKVTGDWITPYFNETTRFDKPPLVYWLMAIAYQTIGVNEWAVRFPSALGAIALVIFGYLTLKHFGFPSPSALPAAAAPLPTQTRQQLWLSALIGSAILAWTPQTIVWARTGVSDMLLSGCMGSALFAFFWGYASPADSPAKKRWYWAFYLLMALAVLTKGPVGVVIPSLTVLLFTVYLGNWREVITEAFPVKGMLLLLTLTVPWYVLVYLANGQAFIDSFFGYHNFERFTRVVNRHSAPWYFYFIVVLVGFMPYSVHLPVAIARLRFWRRHDWRQQPRPTHLGLFALAWLITIFGFFTVAVTKLPSYVLPLMPAAAILVSLLWSDLMTRRQFSRGVWVSSIVSVVFLAAIALALPFLPQFLGRDPAMPGFRPALQDSGLLLWGSAIWLGAALVGTLLLLRRRLHWLWGVQLVGFVLFFLLTAMPLIQMVDAQRQLPLRQLAAVAAAAHQPGDRFVMVGFSKPSLVFYSHLPMTFVRTVDDAIAWLQTTNSSSPPPESLLLLSYPDRLRQLGIPEAALQTLGKAGAYELVRVRLPVQLGVG